MKNKKEAKDNLRKIALNCMKSKSNELQSPVTYHDFMLLVLTLDTIINGPEEDETD